MRNIVLVLIGIFILPFSCAKKDKEQQEDYYKGQMTVSTDESFLNVTQALAETYSYHYPEAKVNVVAVKENQGFIDLLNRKVDVVVMSRALTANEQSEYKRIIDLDPEPAKFAGDAALFVVPIHSARNSISIQEIEKELSSDSKNIIFDGTNSSNLNTVSSVVGKKPTDIKFAVIKGNENIIEQLGNYKNKIGIISLNSISRMHSDEVKKLRSQIKILPIEKDGKLYDASFSNIRNMSYPFTRVLYFLTSEGHFGMANGFIRFSCTNIGQKVVQKEGLQKFNLYERKVQIKQ